MDTAITDADYLDIATSLQVLDIPRKVFISESYSYNIPLTEDADIESFAAYTGESLSSVHTHDQYVDAVVRFQNEHTTCTGDVTRLSLLRTSGILEDILTTTHVTFTNNFGGDTLSLIHI